MVSSATSQRVNWGATYMLLPSKETGVSMRSWACVYRAENLRFSLGLRYARFDSFDFCSTKTSGGTLVLGTRDTLRPDGTLEVGDGGACGRLSLAGLGSHGWYEGCIEVLRY